MHYNKLLKAVPKNFCYNINGLVKFFTRFEIVIFTFDGGGNFSVFSYDFLWREALPVAIDFADRMVNVNGYIGYQGRYRTTECPLTTDQLMQTDPASCKQLVRVQCVINTAEVVC